MATNSYPIKLKFDPVVIEEHRSIQIELEHSVHFEDYTMQHRHWIRVQVPGSNRVHQVTFTVNSDDQELGAALALEAAKVLRVRVRARERK